MIEFKNDNHSSLFQRYPFFSIGLFCGILGIFFSGNLVGKIFFSIIPALIVIKVLIFILAGAGHPVTKFSLVCAAIAVVPLVIGVALRNTAEGFANVLFVIVSILFGLALIGLIVRIFIAIFISKW